PILAHADELPEPVKAIDNQGLTILLSFEAPGGLKGYLGQYQHMGVTISLTPDGTHEISGYMSAEKGENRSNALREKEIYEPAG
ncbi:thiol:disulfide interchange protein DsbG, partial [Salmonella enterica subsp. enterica serovar Oslo]|nr:thiol:disulfide interchange protein DsbG [Salmonella enterica subsp. enterica serovar Oslo]